MSCFFYAESGSNNIRILDLKWTSLGQVCWWDERVGGYAVGQSEFEESHSDAVYTFKWIGKTGTEFFTGSSDGFIKWWDIR